MSGFLTEIYSQPDALRATAQSSEAQVLALAGMLAQLKDGILKRIVFTGMGSSCSAVYPTLLRLLAHGYDARVVEASELLHYQFSLLTSSTLMVIISQSGRSAEIAPLIALAHERNVTVLGITNTPDSPLHQGSTYTLLMQAGVEATVATKTYTCTLALLHLLASALLGQSVDTAASDIASVAESISVHLSGWQTQIAAVADAWANTRFIEYLARGHSMASAQTAALICKESVKIPTESMNAGQFRHGPLELVDDRFTGVLFIGSSVTAALNVKLAHAIIGYGGQLVVIGQGEATIDGTTWITLPECPPDLLPLLEIIPVQLLCAELSVRHGFEAGYFRYINKITVQE